AAEQVETPISLGFWFFVLWDRQRGDLKNAEVLFNQGDVPIVGEVGDAGCMGFREPPFAMPGLFPRGLIVSRSDCRCRK
ncbi:MAG: hypothetical protein SWE60_06740, partial [Thermodesulfobacteriota bacterium]|nr:hypothetical protein [Thermodesulfobacteriota bacterium]